MTDLWGLEAEQQGPLSLFPLIIPAGCGSEQSWEHLHMYTEDPSQVDIGGRHLFILLWGVGTAFSWGMGSK